METDKIPLIIPKGTINTKITLKCPCCGEVAVNHKAHHSIRAGFTDGWMCRACYRTWR